MTTVLLTLWPWFVVIVVIVILEELLRAPRKRIGPVWPTRKRTSPEDYQRRLSLLTPAERSFYGMLIQAMDGQSVIMTKVRLADIVDVRKGLSRRQWQSAFNRIQSKHVDFVLCDPQQLDIKAVVELDDRSHKKPKRQDRDRFVDQVMNFTGIPIFHFPVRCGYSVTEIREALAEK